MVGRRTAMGTFETLRSTSVRRTKRLFWLRRFTSCANNDYNQKLA